MNGNNYYHFDMMDAFANAFLSEEARKLDGTMKKMAERFRTEDADYTEIKPISNGMPEKEVPELEIEEVTDFKNIFSKRQK